MNCNTCGVYVGANDVWGLCETCFDKEGGNEHLGKSLREGQVALIGRGKCLLKVDKSKMQYAVEIVKPRVFDPPMKVKVVKAILAKQVKK